MVEQSYYDEEIIPLTEPGELVPGMATLAQAADDDDDFLDLD
jgi:hypothetical protein